MHSSNYFTTPREKKIKMNVFSLALETESTTQIIPPSAALLPEARSAKPSLPPLQQLFPFLSCFILFYFGEERSMLMEYREMMIEVRGVTLSACTASEISAAQRSQRVLLFFPPLRTHIYTRTCYILNSVGTNSSFTLFPLLSFLFPSFSFFLLFISHPRPPAQPPRPIFFISFFLFSFSSPPLPPLFNLSPSRGRGRGLPRSELVGGSRARRTGRCGPSPPEEPRRLHSAAARGRIFKSLPAPFAQLQTRVFQQRGLHFSPVSRRSAAARSPAHFAWLETITPFKISLWQ